MSGRICGIEDCDKAHLAKGLCPMHYRRLRKYGDVEFRHYARAESVEESIGLRTERQGDCLVWTGSLTAGYGRVSVDGQAVYLHRYMWEQTNGPIPADMEVDHACRNRACCEVGHLRVVTRKQNMENLGGARASNQSTSMWGVSFHKRTGKYQARVMHNKVSHYLGLFDTPDEAAMAARSKRLELFTHNAVERVAS